MAAADKPFEGTHDKDKINIRRDIVSRLASRKMRPHQILKVLKANAETAWLIEGYENPYQVIRNDIKKGPETLTHRVTKDVAAKGLKDYISGIESQIAHLWDEVDNGILDSEGIRVPVTGADRLKYMELIRDLNRDLAMALGVTTDSPAATAAPQLPGGGPNFNIFGGGPESLMQAARAAQALAAGESMDSIQERAAHSDRSHRKPVELEVGTASAQHDPKETVIDTDDLA